MIIPIVEGFAEVEAVPELLRRLLWADGIWDVEIAKPFRVKRNKVVKAGEIERAVELAVSDRPGGEAVIVILDADDDDPDRLAADLLGRACVATGLPVVVAVATREYECWLLGAKESLRGTRGIRADATAPDNPEALRDGKGHLSDNMEGDRGYVEVEDQTALSAQLDIEAAEAACPSFRKLREDVRRVVVDIRSRRGPVEGGG